MAGSKQWNEVIGIDEVAIHQSFSGGQLLGYIERGEGGLGTNRLNSLGKRACSRIAILLRNVFMERNARRKVLWIIVAESAADSFANISVRLLRIPSKEFENFTL